ncbi:putative amidase [Microlunatus phosphovorus NM-1]|uniref:Putative amidase n=1 Tax=Microlunatus phosphovorus (strain ATCC 700054 / DSM 10555 / JCM 9379 / NBRC 101784 / NCIMB 13414 / VKM Ac-1990 / NM-1) TaxID=1032480 RepID=F5XM06_MICPN|nr:amidase [Microlunatus phosphovorus]BAK33885.1 putative amidase [Microlunatus phosphovorus NM-1]
MMSIPAAERERFTLPLARRRLLAERGAIDADRYRRELVDYVRRFDPQVRAFADWRPADLEGSPLPYGCTVSYKDTIDVAGFPTRLGIRSGYRSYPSRSAAIASQLSARGLLCVGKAAVTECALGTERPSLNPTYPDLSASGSSTGSAVSVAAGFCDVSVGTDSGGSIRWPAVYCGATALRLTPRSDRLTGVHAVSPSLESVGLIARTPADLDWLWRTYGLGAALGAEPSLQRHRLRIGVTVPPGERLHSEVADALAAVADRLADRGHVLSHPDLGWAWRQRADAWELLSREAYDGFGALLDDTRCTPLAADTRLAVETGARTSDARYAELRRRQQQVSSRLARLLTDEFDLLAVPLEKGLPDRADRQYASVVPTEQPDAVDLSLTILASHARLPVLALPVVLSTDGAPIGLQLLARPGAEDLLISAAKLVSALCQPYHLQEAS